LSGGEPGDVFVPDLVALGAELGDGFRCTWCSREHRHQSGIPLALPRPPGRPACRPDHLSSLLSEIGVPVAAARGAAIRQQHLELPAPVVADALGYHDKTTSRLLKETGGT
jgi:hypothetical protein